MYLFSTALQLLMDGYNKYWIQHLLISYVNTGSVCVLAVRNLWKIDPFVTKEKKI